MIPIEAVSTTLDLARNNGLFTLPTTIYNEVSYFLKDLD